MVHSFPRLLRVGSRLGGGTAVWANSCVGAYVLTLVGAGEGYPIQMYSVIRQVSEAINLIRLVADDPDRAQDWLDGNFRELTPKKVRPQRDCVEDPPQRGRRC